MCYGPLGEDLLTFISVCFITFCLNLVGLTIRDFNVVNYSGSFHGVLCTLYCELCTVKYSWSFHCALCKWGISFSSWFFWYLSLTFYIVCDWFRKTFPIQDLKIDNKFMMVVDPQWLHPTEILMCTLQRMRCLTIVVQDTSCYPIYPIFKIWEGWHWLSTIWHSLVIQNMTLLVMWQWMSWMTVEVSTT